MGGKSPDGEINQLSIRHRKSPVVFINRSLRLEQEGVLTTFIKYT